jgi:hypothetical protein
VAIEQGIFGGEHPEAAATLASLAALYRAQGKNELSVQTYKRALTMIEKTLGAQDPLATEIREQIK